MPSRPLNPEWHALLLGVLRRAALGNLPFFGLVGTLAGLLFILPIYWLML